MKSRYTECLELVKIDTSKFKKVDDRYNLTTEKLSNISHNHIEIIHCIERNRHREIESDKLKIMKNEYQDLKAILKELRIIEQAVLEKMPDSEINSPEVVKKRQRARDRNRVVISKLQEEIIESSYAISQMSHIWPNVLYIAFGVAITILVEIVGIVLYNQIK